MGNLTEFFRSFAQRAHTDLALRFLIWWVGNLTEFFRTFAPRAHTDPADLTVFALVGGKSHRIFSAPLLQGLTQIQRDSTKTIIRAIRKIRG